MELAHLAGLTALNTSSGLLTAQLLWTDSSHCKWSQEWEVICLSGFLRA